MRCLSAKYVQVHLRPGRNPLSIQSILASDLAGPLSLLPSPMSIPNSGLFQDLVSPFGSEYNCEGHTCWNSVFIFGAPFPSYNRVI